MALLPLLVLLPFLALLASGRLRHRAPYDPRRRPVRRVAVWLLVGLGLATGMMMGRSLPVAAETRFIDALGDVPLMPGLTLEEGETVVFDAPSGRIVEISVLGTVSPAAARRFYAATLPSLGWIQAADDPGRYHREDETLVLTFTPQEGLSPDSYGDTSLHVHFSLSPREGGP